MSIRSSSFFQAASTLQGLQGHLADAVGCIQGLRQELAAADVQLYSTAAAVKALQARRDNLQDTLDITKVGGSGRGGGSRRGWGGVEVGRYRVACGVLLSQGDRGGYNLFRWHGRCRDVVDESSSSSSMRVFNTLRTLHTL